MNLQISPRLHSIMCAQNIDYNYKDATFDFEFANGLS